MVAHAAVEHALSRPQETGCTPVVAVLECKDEVRLAALADELSDNLHVTKFFEPDLDNELVSLAAIASNSKSLKRLPLLHHRRGGETK